LLHTEEMRKIRIIALKNRKHEIIRELHRRGVIDIRRSAIEAQDDAAVEVPAVSELLVRYLSAEVILRKHLDKKLRVVVEKHLDEKKVRAHAASHGQVDGELLISKARSLKAVAEVFSLEERRNAIENELNAVAEARELASRFTGTGIDFSMLRSDVLSFKAFSVANSASAKVDAVLARLKGDHEIIDKRAKSGRILFIAYRTGSADALEGIAGMGGVYEIDIDNARLDGKAEDVLARLDRRQARLAEERAGIVRRLDSIASKSYLEISSLIEMLSVEAERAGISASFKKTDSTFIIEGWIVKGRLGQLRDSLNRVAKGRFMLDELETDELAPTLVRRPEFLKPFDFLVSFVDIPRSDEIDPTWIFIITFPIFYGLMVSDVGYGLMSLLLATLVTRITNPDDLVCNTAKIWQMCSIFIILFGFLSNQYFGLQLNQYFTSFQGFDWLKDLTTILAVGIVMGITQVTLGLAFGFVNQYRKGHVKHAISKITSAVFLLAGTVAIAGTFFGLVGYGITVAAAAASIAGALATVALSGMDAVEMASLISNPLSYARLMGFGLASIMIGLLIDIVFTPSLSSGILVFSLTAVIFILLHFMNMILGIFEGSVQAVRLNFVEFFSKFYEGGGVRFSPFGYKRRYTKEE
jgi:V/A-type H+/Na+-transporting ATPase subunit I